MKGRQWRHFCVEWPHIVPGLFGPASWNTRDVPPSPVQDLAATCPIVVHPSWADDYSDGDATDDSEEESTPLFGTSASGPLIHDPFYRELFGSMPLEDAVLHMFCQAAKLNGILCGDNMADTVVITRKDAVYMAELAKNLVKSIQVLLGPVHTTKLHRLADHLLQELLNRGNLWEGDTSTNESQHGSVKHMFRRSNKGGATLMLQMLRAEETQRDVLKSYERAERLAEREAEQAAARDFAAQDDREPTEEQEARAELLRKNKRGVPVSIASVAEGAGLSGLAAALRVPVDASAVITNTIVLRAVFEWNAKGTAQHVRGADNFRGAPWYSFIRYRAGHGSTRWGMVRAAFRAVACVRRPCFVVQCMRRYPARPGCVLSVFGCIRLAWDYDAADSEWPRLEAVEASNFLRLEQVHVDWQDMTERHGLFATPTSIPTSATERRATRFFTNAFYPWTTRAQTLFE